MTGGDERPWIAALRELNFTALEAEVYAALVAERSATGYRLAKLVGKQVANVYKAIQSLEEKGAIAIQGGQVREARAVPPEELLRHLAHQFERRRAHASEALARLPTSEGDQRVYELRSPELVFERARTMLVGAERIALLDVGAGPLVELRRDLEQAAARGVDIALRTEAPVAVKGVEVAVIPPRAAARDEPWPADWLTLVVDGREELLALFSADGRQVQQAVYSESAFLSWVFHSGLVAEIARDEALRVLAAGGSATDVAQALTRYERLAPADAPGRKQLMRSLIDHTGRGPAKDEP
jgi:sugar-specific transcriptional regulator TrmB